MLHNLTNALQALALIFTLWVVPGVLIVATYLAGTRGGRALARATVCRGVTTRDREAAARAAAMRRHPSALGSLADHAARH